MGGDDNPALMALTLYIGLTGLPLGMQRVEILLKTFLRGLSSVDSASQRFWFLNLGRSSHQALPTAVFFSSWSSDLTAGTTPTLVTPFSFLGPAAFLFARTVRLIPKKA
jgi:hypothetical protein